MPSMEQQIADRQARNDRATLNRWIRRYHLNPVQAFWAESHFIESGLAAAKEYIVGVKLIEKMVMTA